MKFKRDEIYLNNNKLNQVTSIGYVPQKKNRIKILMLVQIWNKLNFYRF